MTASHFLHLRDLEILSSFLRREALTASNFNDSLVIASLYGRLHWDNISGFFGDHEFEAKLLYKWKDQFQEQPTVDVAQHKKATKWVFVLTRGTATGGHSRLLKQLSGGLTQYNIEQSLVVTHRAPSGVLRSLPEQLKPGKVLKGSLEKKTRSLYKNLHDADVILLLNNPDDIVAALAARALREKGKRVLFINHADHVFSFGPSAADTVMEICATGWKTTEERRSPNSQSFMGIPLVNASVGSFDTRNDTSGPILSIGGAGKYRPSANLSFPLFLDRILSLVPNDVVLIGPSKKDEWWTNVFNKYPGRIHLMGTQPTEVVQAEFSRASCYVDSFPMDGGTVFSEAIMHGLPAFGLNRMAALGISPADALRCAGLEQLVASVAQYCQSGDIPEGLHFVRSQISQEFSNTAVADRVFKASSGTYTLLPEFLANLGNRSPDYNAENWMENAELYCPKRLWRKLSIRSKVRMLSNISRLGLSRSLLNECRYRLILG